MNALVEDSMTSSDMFSTIYDISSCFTKENLREGWWIGVILPILIECCTSKVLPIY